MSAEWDAAMVARADLAKRVAAGTANFATSFVCLATTFGGPHDIGTGFGGYKGEDLRRWCFPDPFAVAELSTNFTAPLADLDYRALMLGLPVEDRRPIIAARVQGDPETGLPHRWPFRVSFSGFSATCAKLDIGRGGPGAQGVKRSADLFWVLAAWLGVENTRTSGWSGIVRVDIALP